MSFGFDDSRLFQHEVMPRHELDALLREYRRLADEHGADSKAALAVRNKVVTANMRLVLHVAKRYTAPRGMEPADLHAYGVLGLMSAVQRFDVSLGHAFSTYATYWVRHAIGRHLKDLAHAIRVPCHVQGNNTTAGADFVQAAEAARRMHSLDAKVNDTGGRTFMDLMEGDGDDALETVECAEDMARVRAALDALPPKLRKVVELRYWQDATLKDVGAQLEGGLSRERTRQLEAEAFGMLRAQLREHGAA